MLGSILALSSAASFGLNDASIRRGVLTGTPFQAMVISVPVGVLVFLAGALIAGSAWQIFEFSEATYLFLALGGIVHFCWGRYWSYSAIRALGSNLASPVQQTSLIVALGGAVLFLEEVLTPLRLLGIVLIFLGSLAILNIGKARVDGAPKSAENSEFQPKYLRGYLFATLSVLGFGTSSIFVRAALEGSSPSAGLPGGVISYVAATLVIAVTLMGRRQREHVLTVDGRSLRWFAFSGVLVCLSHVFRFMALAIAPVSVVAPLIQTLIIFRVFFGWFLNRDHEDYSLWTFVGIVVSLMGAFTLSISADFVNDNFTLPETLVEVIHWHWP
ncbi:MAG: EamA family transporter [Pseudomonadota bacterium]|nr:EamA family transporter [Pseudomonadota bacterium]